MSKRFAATVIIINVVTGSLLYLFSEYTFLVLRGTVVQSVNIFIAFGYPGYAPGYGYEPPTMTASLPNFPFFVFFLSLMANICFIMMLQRTKNQSDSMTKGFTSNIIAANIGMSLLLFLSSEYVLLLFKNLILEDVSIFNVYQGFLGNPPTFTEPLPNFPFYAFLFYLMVNVIFVIKLQRSKQQR